MFYDSSVGVYDDDTDDFQGGTRFSDGQWIEEDECIKRCDGIFSEVAWRSSLCSRPGRAAILVLIMLIVYFISLVLTNTHGTSLTDTNDATSRVGVNVSRAVEVLTALCNGYDTGRASGDSCNRLCYNKKWHITDYYEGNKVVIMIKDGGQTAVYKSSHLLIDDFESVEESLPYEHFTDKVLDVVNKELRFGWPRHYKRHLLEILWPTLLRTPGEPMLLSDRVSLWALLQQPEFILFRVLPLTRVTPKIIGTCGHFYQTESLVAFKMKGYYMNLKGKILVHLMGTLKLLYEFLNEPLQWCDVRFENLGLSADYPKRFILMDGDMVYTQSRLSELLSGRSCESDKDCAIGDCLARCTADMTCSDRTNQNLEVFCDKLVGKLFGNTWSKNNRYLVACHDTGKNITQRLNDLRLTWSWNLPDV